MSDIIDYRLLDFLPGGTGVAFGQVAQNEGFEVNWDAKFNHDVNIIGALKFHPQDTAPTEVNQDGLKIVVLDSEPAQKYEGWLYIIKDNNASLFPVGSCYTTSTHTNPSDWLGGTWTLIDKQFTPTTITSGFTFNTTNTQNGVFEARLSGNTIHFRLYWYNKTAISDNTVDIGVLTKSDVGISAGPSAYPVGYNDYLAAIGMFIINFGTASATTATLQVLDWTTTATTKPTTTGQTCDLSFIINFTPDEMLDSFCNQFIWQRTA